MFNLTPVNNGWNAFFNQEFQKDYFKSLHSFLNDEHHLGKNIYPSPDRIFSAFQSCSTECLKLVLIGQDPYPTRNVANGLCFSVSDGVKIPASLKNIFKELNRDFGCPVPDSGNLQSWADQGVLMLNTVLTVVEKTPNAHKNKGWEVFTSSAIDFINQLDRRVVFLAWGAQAHEVCELVDLDKHDVVRTSHPSNMGGACKRSGVTKSGHDYPAFMGSSCFTKANRLVERNGFAPIDWTIVSNSSDLFS